MKRGPDVGWMVFAVMACVLAAKLVSGQSMVCVFKDQGFAALDVEALGSLAAAVEMGDKALLKKLIDSGRVLIPEKGEVCTVINADPLGLPGFVKVMIKGRDGKWLTLTKFLARKESSGDTREGPGDAPTVGGPRKGR